MSIVFAILKVVGWMLLALAALLLLLVLSLCFYPVFYRVSGQSDGENHLSLQGKLSWLFHILGLELFVENGRMLLLLRFFFFRKRLFFGREAERLADRFEEAAEETADRLQADIAEEVPDRFQEETIADNPDRPPDAAADAPEKPIMQREKKKPLWERISDWIMARRNRIADRIAEFRRQWKRGRAFAKGLKRIVSDEQNKLAFSHIKSELVRILKAYAPRRLRLSLQFSAGAPDVTGVALGVLAVFPAAYQNRWEITPDFERDQAYAKGACSVRGHLVLGRLFAGLFRIYFDKRCRRMYAMVKRYLRVE